MERLNLVLISDTHNKRFKIEKKVDAVLHAGDLTNYGEKDSPSVISLQESDFPSYWVKGNHDIGLNYIKGCHNITEKSTEIKGYSIKGVSMSPCYNAPKLSEYWVNMTSNKDEEKQYYETHLDKYYDIILSHSPPWGNVGTELGCGNIGSTFLLEYIYEFQPRLVVCGHVHKPLNRVTKYYNTTVINTAQRITYVNIDNGEEILASFKAG